MLQLGQAQEARRLAQPLSPGDRHIECPARVLALIHLSTGEPQAALDDLEACLVLGDLHSERTDRATCTPSPRPPTWPRATPPRPTSPSTAPCSRPATRAPSWVFGTLPEPTCSTISSARAVQRDQPQATLGVLARLHAAEGRRTCRPSRSR